MLAPAQIISDLEFRLSMTTAELNAAKERIAELEWELKYGGTCG